MLIRPATFQERQAYLDNADPGFVAIEQAQVVGQIAFNTANRGMFFVHSFESSGPQKVAAALVQAVRKEAKAQGFSKIDFVVSDPKVLERYNRKGRARTVKTWMELDT